MKIGSLEDINRNGGAAPTKSNSRGGRTRQSAARRSYNLLTESRSVLYQERRRKRRRRRRLLSWTCQIPRRCELEGLALYEVRAIFPRTCDHRNGDRTSNDEDAARRPRTMEEKEREEMVEVGGGKGGVEVGGREEGR